MSAAPLPPAAAPLPQVAVERPWRARLQPRVLPASSCASPCAGVAKGCSRRKSGKKAQPQWRRVLPRPRCPTAAHVRPPAASSMPRWMAPGTRQRMPWARGACRRRQSKGTATIRAPPARRLPRGAARCPPPGASASRRRALPDTLGHTSRSENPPPRPPRRARGLQTPSALAAVQTRSTPQTELRTAPAPPGRARSGFPVPAAQCVVDTRGAAPRSARPALHTPPPLRRARRPSWGATLADARGVHTRRSGRHQRVAVDRLRAPSPQLLCSAVPLATARGGFGSTCLWLLGQLEILGV